MSKTTFVYNLKKFGLTLFYSFASVLRFITHSYETETYTKNYEELMLDIEENACKNDGIQVACENVDLIKTSL